MTALRLRRTGVAVLLLVALQPWTVWAAPAPPIRVVMADDVALASLLLIGEGRSRPVVLFDARDPDALAHYRRGRKRAVECMRRAGSNGPATAILEEAAGAPCVQVDDLLALSRSLWPQAKTAIATATGDYEWLLRAAAFAGAADGALLPVAANAPFTPELFRDWPIETLYLTPSMHAWKDAAAAVVPHVVLVPDPDALTADLVRHRGIEPPTAIVIANARDRYGIFSPSSLSLLARLVSAVHRAPLFLAASPDPEVIEREVGLWIERHRLQPTHVILVGDELALRSHRVADPVLAAGGPEALGGGTEVRVELFSQIQHEQPQDYAVGRLVAEDVARASATLARQLHHHPSRKNPQPVILLSNADEVFALGETISRTTASEMRNVNVPVRSFFRGEITPAVIQKALQGTDLLVWEGHARDLTLEERGDVAADSTPAFVILQGCYTLDRSDPFILMERGTEAIVATSAAIYSASGSAFARALFDSLLYQGADLGTAVRDARNYLLALTQLKRQRGHKDWTKTYRAALAFALWGDPTVHPPLKPARPAMTPVRWTTDDAGLSLTIPDRRLPPVAVGRYRAEPVPRAMLGGLILNEGGPTRRLKDLYFNVQTHANGPVTACKPSAGWDVITLYAPRTRTLSILARPEWEDLGLSAERGTFHFPLAREAKTCPAVPAAPRAAKP